MGLRFTVLASGSGGNAALVQSNDFGLLIDLGLGPRQLAARFAAAGLHWSAVRAVVLTHTHTDHWKDRTLAHLHKHGIPLFCHPEHCPVLRLYSPAFTGLENAGLVNSYVGGADMPLAPGMRCRPIAVRHDGGPTFGFRIEGGGDLFGSAPALAYAADLGSWDEGLIDHLADVDLLAVEFNHDVRMERLSGRSYQLIARVLGDEGHLSNEQAATLVRAVLARSQPPRVKHLVQLHLSRECNRPGLAQQAAQAVLDGTDIALCTAQQDYPAPTLELGNGVAPEPPARRSTSRTSRRPAAEGHPWLPGLEWE
jgi:ribonuclease BN (tRNA processing enzyme)